MKKRLLIFFAVILAAVFTVCGSAAMAEEDGNLAINGGFERTAENTELPEGWFYEAWETDPAEGYAMRSEDDGGTAYLWSAGNDVRLCQTIEVKAKSYYKLTCRVRTEDVAGGAGANVSVVGSLAASEGVYGTNGWQTLELVGKTGKKQTELTVCARIGGYGAEASGSAWFDDFSVEFLEDFSGDAADFSSASAEVETAGEYADGEIPYLAESCMALFLAACLMFYFYQRFILRADTLTGVALHERFALACILFGAFLLRGLLSLLVYGHPTDISCFMAWSNALAENGPAAFYTSGMFADYPPGYMYVLWLTGSIAKMLGLTYGSAGYVLLTKMPAILADLGAAYLVYQMAAKRGASLGKAEGSGTLALVLAAVVAFNPAMAFISGGWGQIDQVLTLLLVAVVALFLKKKVILAGLVYGAAILVKPQALMAGPLFAAAYFAYGKDEGWKGLLRTLAAVVSAVAALFVLSLPFRGGQEPLWFLEKLLGTATSYPYASIEAFNLFALLGGNWADVNQTPFLFSFKIWGTILICLSVAFSAFLYLKGRKREPHALTLSLAFLLTAIFMLGHYMHERYLFPALLLLLVAFIAYGDRRIFISFAWLTCSLLFNSLMAIVIVDHQQARGMTYDIVTAAGSLLNLGGFAYLTYTCCDILLRRRKHPAFCEKTPERPQPSNELPKPVDAKLHFTKRDQLYCIALTAAYAVIALINLGTTTAPETPWYGQAGETYKIEFGQTAEIAEIRVFGGLYTGSILLRAEDGTEYTYTEENGDMFRWKDIADDVPATTTGFTLSVTDGTVWFNELAFFDAAGNYIPATAEGNAAALFDEPEEVPETPSYLNGMYFDELYHARTAYEHLHGLSPYENSHPPLGKVFIMLGIAIFGMNAFGWRIIGTLFGIGMVPILYVFAKRLFKKSDYALLASFLFAFDFMHFTQTRIATIDVYGVFFILLMYYYMYQYYRMNFFSDGLQKTLRPLALAGIFFGLGAASKWICFYASAGLAVIFFTSLVQRYLEYRRFRNSEDETLRKTVKPFWSNALRTCIWCCAFYILIPAAIYLLSYLPYVLSVDRYGIKEIWGVQEFMFSYHSGLTATHSYQSPWWQWPLLIRPMWYYVGYDVAPGNISTISAMGNPAVWWVCSAATGVVIYSLLRGKRKGDSELFVLLVGLLANYLPWVLISRCTFIYHFFASVPFILLITVYALQKKEERDARYAKLKWIWMAAALALFALFYPVISGAECARAYVSFLEWLPSWTFMGV